MSLEQSDNGIEIDVTYRLLLAVYLAISLRFHSMFMVDVID